jgi:hypothetical protein
MAKDLSKALLYESVKVLVEEDYPHLHLPQHKLFTLFSIAFQYFLFQSTKNHGAYIIRIEDSILADKLARKTKDPSTRKYIQSIMLPRKLKVDKSVFYLDFFHIGSWNLTNDIPREKLKGALIVKNTSTKPMDDLVDVSMDAEQEGQESAEASILTELPKDYYYSSLQECVERTIIIAYENSFENTRQITFPFIKKMQEKTVSGVTISGNIDWDNLD